MQKLSHGLFENAARFEEKSEPHDIIGRAARGQDLSSSETTRMFDWLVYETRSVLSNVLNQEGKGADIRNAPLHGHCSFSQSVGVYALRDRGLSPMPFSAQSLPEYHVGHAMMTVSVREDGKDATYLVDPTYRQFCDPARPETEDGKPMPGYFLKEEQGGPEIIKTLMTDGYIKLTPDVAHKYLASFCEGRPPFETDAKSMAFMQSPPDDNGLKSFAREHMQRGGYLIPSHTH